jgi:hypothetical protein
MGDAMPAMARATAAIKIKAARGHLARGHPAGAAVVDLLAADLLAAVQRAVSRIRIHLLLFWQG